MILDTSDLKIFEISNFCDCIQNRHWLNQETINDMDNNKAQQNSVKGVHS